MNRTICRHIIGIVLVLLSAAVAGADVSADVKKILQEIRQDQPVPKIGYLQRSKPVNVDCGYYRGNYQGVEIAVETHPKSDHIASVLLRIPGPDLTAQLLPVVKGVIGPPRYSRPKESRYGWEWPNYRTGSLHYVKGNKPGAGFTVVSLFYQ